MRFPSLLTGLAAGTRCEGCGRPGSLFCLSCSNNEPQAATEPPIQGVDLVVARWAYEGVPRSLILDLKLRGARLCAASLAEGVVSETHKQGLIGSLITWVPARRSDIRVRGFDHAALLAQEISRRLGMPLAELLIRRSDPPDQTTLSAADRKRNLDGAFEARPSTGGVIVVDDLVTTGATAAACALALRRSGAQRVELLVPCRA